ncbi:ATP-dependent helicase [Bifidobacterium bifidum]|uniref:ATP-dependent DNA helicase n=1 Tax=Bifidobacterium bifidum TaxID=1681 RepID=UPI0018DC6A98|nr:ATP-dependent DNA helicase [Bifidobacterium bifidum]MBH8615588.1 ATP-dependent helicase [Bifidobacterium bifidum]
MNAPRFTDSPEQAKVVNAPTGDDVLVVAGAGSGKTYTMTRRIINLIAQGVPAERILGLTFTRKAASELLSRVSAAVLADGGDERFANRAFLKPEVSTYDAFFQTIVRQYGLLVGFDQNTQPLSQAGAIQLATTVVGRHMDILFEQDLGAFKTVVNGVLGLSHAIGNAMIGGSTTTMDEAIGRVRAWDQAFLAQLDIAIGDTPVPDEAPKAKVPTKNKKDTEETFAAKQEEYRAQLRDICVYKCAQLRDVTRRRETLLTLVEEYEREKRVQNMAEFSDFTIAAYQLVARFPSIGERYRRRYTHVLLDEYQDTSTTQAMLLATLFHPQSDADADRSSSRWREAARSAGGRSKDGVGLSRSAVNAVGDPFQSIYAWRGASPGAFRMFQKDFGMPADAKPYPLSVTRRNTCIVLRAANNLTEPLRIPPRRAGSSLMREVDVANLSAMDNAAEGTIGVLGFATFGQEADAVARFAKQAIARYRKDAAATAASDTPHVAVLFRGKTHMAQFAQELERAGLTTLVVGYSALLERPEVQDLIALLHAAADHTDSASLMRLLATPRFGLGSESLTRLAGMAEDLDSQCRYRALVESGIIGSGSDGARADDGHDEATVPTSIDSGLVSEADGGSDIATFADPQVKAIVKQYRDRVPHAVFLIDMMMRDDLPSLLSRRGGFDETTSHRIIQAGEVLQRVHAVTNHPLKEVIDAAVRALNLDIDTIVAQAVKNPSQPVNPTQARSPLQSVAALVDTYTQEIVEGVNPTLRGFMSWVDSLGQIEEDTAAVPDTPADVVLMTIHQAKGLEWDAVAVVSMQSGVFPSNQGGLHVELDAEHPGGGAGESWTPPEYKATVRSWADDPAAVPAPVRVDAGILPRFPHDANPDDAPVETLRALDDVEVIDDEFYGDLRSKDIGDDMDVADPSSWYLTQEEEYGRCLLADERRLAYVALTRAKKDALLTYSQYSILDRDPSQYLNRPGKRPSASKPSVFWTEMQDSLCHESGLVSACKSGSAGYSENADAIADSSPDLAVAGAASGASAHPSLDQLGVDRPQGFFVGDHATEYERDVVEEAWNAPLEEREQGGGPTWPAKLSEETLSKLTGGMSGDSGLVTDDPDSLLARARMLVEDPDLMPWSFGRGEREIDRYVRRQAEHLLEHGRQNVTALQVRAGHMTQREERGYWRGLIRPIPRVASPAAEAGTLFHAWAEQFINAYGDGQSIDADGIGAYDSSSIETGTAGTCREPVTRESLLHDLSELEMKSDTLTAKERQLTVWQRRLAESTWSERRPAWAERQIVVSIPQLGDVIVNGKLDAVFHGGLDANDPTKQYTIVDWKTGRKPRKPQDIEHKLVQLDWYRLLLSYIEHVPLDRIDATLYYLSEPDEGARELHARAKTEQEILAELSSGIPEGSDND